MTNKLECIRDETINNLTTKKVVCSSAVQNVGTIKNTKMIKFLPKGSLQFQGVSIVKAMSLLMVMKTMWQIRLI
jgi:hypothetical protein